MEASLTQRAKPGRYGIEQAFARNLRPARPEVALDGAALRFTRYPFEPASVFPAGTVEAGQITEVNFRYPCDHVPLENGDIVFVPHAGKAALVTLINEHDVPVERRRSVWSALLDPFLDTWEEQQSIDAQFAWLASLGLDRAAVDAWRHEVAAAMVAYNFGTHLWEWGILDLYDVLVAQRARLGRGAFADFYSRAIRLAALDPLSPPWKASSGNNIAGALFAVLLEWSQEVERLKQALAAELTSAYSQPHRRYHTVAHIEKCLDELAGVWDFAIHLDEVRWAILFHDAVYDPRRDDNEARSADWAGSVMDALKRPEEEKARVRAMILATAHSGEPRTPDEALLLDIDLSILGADEAASDEYERGIRAEYAWVSEHDYRQGRAKLLGSFLRRERLYHTAPYRARCESAARRNIERALARLR